MFLGPCIAVRTGCIPHVSERATLSGSVDFIYGLRFPPTLHYK
jgi:hypothetical protein